MRSKIQREHFPAFVFSVSIFRGIVSRLDREKNIQFGDNNQDERKTNLTTIAVTFHSVKPKFIDFNCNAYPHILNCRIPCLVIRVVDYMQKLSKQIYIFRRHEVTSVAAKLLVK